MMGKSLERRGISVVVVIILFLQDQQEVATESNDLSGVRMQ